MKLLIAINFITLLFSCSQTNANQTGNTRIVPDTTAYQKISVATDDYTIHFCLPENCKKVIIKDSAVKQENVKIRLLETYTDDNSKIKVYISDVHEPQEYMNQLRNKIENDKSRIFRADTLLENTTITIRYIYNLPEKDMVDFKNFIFPKGDDKHFCFMTDFVLMKNTPKEYLDKLKYCLENFFLKKN